MLILANDLAKADDFLERAGLYPTVVVLSVGVFVLACLGRAVENHIRHLYGKPYLQFFNPRFLVSTIGYILVADGFLVGSVFELRLPLHTATVTVSAGLVCLIASLVMSVVPHVRQIRRVRRGDPSAAPPESGDRP